MREGPAQQRWSGMKIYGVFAGYRGKAGGEAGPGPGRSD